MFIRIRLIALLFLLHSLAVAADAAALSTPTHPCLEAVSVGLETVRQIAGHGAFESRLFTVFVAEPGWLLLDVAPLAGDGVEPRLGSFGRF